MKYIHAAPLALALVITGMAAQAQSPNETIVVTSARTLNQMVEAVSDDLDRSLELQSRGRISGDRRGVVSVRFTAGPDGKAQNIETYRRDSSRWVHSAAHRAVRSLDGLQPLPANVSPDAVFQANIIFANDEEDKAKLERNLAREEAQRIASSPSERKVLAMTVSSVRRF